MPVRGDIPDRAICFMPGLFGCQTDVAQKMIIQPDEGAALAEQGLHLCKAVQQPQAAGGMEAAGGEDAEHGGGFHAMW